MVIDKCAIYPKRSEPLRSKWNVAALLFFNKKEKEMSQNTEKKPNSGQFKKGNEIGKATRLKPGHTLSKKYTKEYAYDVLAFFEEAEDLVFVEDWALSRKISIPCSWGLRKPRP